MTCASPELGVGHAQLSPKEKGVLEVEAGDPVGSIGRIDRGGDGFMKVSA